MIEEESSPLNEDKPSPREKGQQVRGVLKRPSTSEELGSRLSPLEALSISPPVTPTRSISFKDPLDTFETDTVTAGGGPSTSDGATDGTYYDYFRISFEKQWCCRDTSGDDEEFLV